MFVESPRQSHRTVRLRTEPCLAVRMMFRFLGRYDDKERELVLSRHAKINFLAGGNMVVFSRNGHVVSVQLDKGLWEYIPADSHR